MCGIFGTAGTTPNEQTLGGMMARLTHRGPDGNGLWLGSNIALGHTRLAIVDLSDSGRQPMTLGDLHCSVNGEIYNYPELRRDLEARYGAAFFSQCDSEVVLHGYRHEGEAFFARLSGMFAIALYDLAQDRLLLLRDRAGIKPLYYCNHHGAFAFASEIKSLLAAYDEHYWPIDPLGLSEYMAYQTALGGRTLFAGVRLLAPGHLLTLTPSAIGALQSIPFYQDATLPDASPGFEQVAARYAEMFSQSVSRHLLSDVPVAAYISAGFDSASVAVQAARNSGKKLTAFTGRFTGQGGWYDETLVAREAVESFGGRHVCVPIGSEDFAANLDAVIDALDEPKMGMGAFSQYMVAKAAAKEFRVILTGHGGDELFSGYPVFKLAQLSTLMTLRRSEFPHAAYFILSQCKRLFHREYGRHMPVIWPMRMQRKLLGRAVAGLRPWEALAALHRHCADNAQRIFRTYLDIYLPNLLVVEDKISMAHALESRTPMLDNAMIDFSKSVPQSVKVHGGELKAIVKHYARTLLPECFFRQPKRGFPTPLRLWLRGPLTGMLRERLLGEQSRLHRLFDSKALAVIVDRYEHSFYRHIRPLDEIQSHRMWQLLSLEAWLRIWEEKYGITLVLK